MASLKERLTGKVSELRARRPFFDHLVRMQEHFGQVKGNLQAGAVTYFAFLSFFPILALGFFSVGYVSRVWPEAEENLTEALDSVLPGMIGEAEGQISLESIQSAAGAIGLIGLLGVIYAGLGWLSGMREALLVVFETPARAQPNFVVGKLRDLVSLGLIGVVMVLSVAVSGVISRFSRELLELVGLGVGLSPLLTGLSVVVGLGASAVLFYALFRLLANPDLPRKPLWSGALLGAIGFEVLKQLSTLLMASTKNQPAFQAFGIALILVVWINYFSRVVMYAASWAHTAPAARLHRDELERRRRHRAWSEERNERARRRKAGEAPAVAPQNASETAVAFVAGGGAMLGFVALVRRLTRR
ncbi:YhjD/YihY/BrkB family envelope integrity protein [Nocardioides sp. AE5]|uniref:YihY/virulence factor BrkB family protein n=1 Tax=Nocardioides sp. AE5 TaxID=2962573 RepID=UPI0028828D03|nr:YhjD/YihY/BrkB family envelope integrity protein [Nocardioides sp. AE5]MDT0201980.1 YhjD/YihY/BrkB family envelope integrity protein [Nocardioides sp. AE5]